MANVKQLMKNNKVFLVAVPGIILIHWAWFRLQENELFVPREQKNVFPGLTAFKDKIINKFTFSKTPESE